MAMAACGLSPFSQWAFSQANRYYVGYGRAWNTTNSWSDTPGGASGASVPAIGDTAWLSGPTTTNVPMDANYSLPGLAASYIDGASGATFTLSQTASATQLVSSDEYVGYSGSRAVKQTNGGHRAGTNLFLGSSCPPATTKRWC